MNEPAGVSTTDPGLGMGSGSARPGDGEPSPGGRLPWLVFAAVLVLMILGRYAEYRVNGEPPDGWIADSLMGIAFMSFPAMGALIASRRRGHGFGWLLLAIGGGAALLVASSGYAAWRVPGGHTDPLTVLAAWTYQWLWFPLILSVPTFMFLLFPTGTYASSRWRWVGRATMAFLVIITLPAMLEDRLIVEHEPREGIVEYASVDNPIGVSFLTDTEQQLGFLFAGAFPLVLLSFASLVFRYRSNTSVERQQMKWVGVAAAFFGVAILLGNSIGVTDRLFPVFLMMLPLSMAVSVLKYRLYDIDLIVNRTLVYGALTAILGLVYFGIIVLLQSALGDVTEQNDLAIAGSTLAVAGLFRPLRGRVQTFIDQRFYRRKYDARQTLESFSSHLRDEVDLDHLAHALTGIVSETMQPAHVSVWLRTSEQ